MGEDEAATGIALSTTIESTFKQAVKELKDAGTVKFFPNGIQYIKIDVKITPPSGTLEISGDVTKPHGPGSSHPENVTSYARPMVYAPPNGAVKSLTLTVTETGSRGDHQIQLNQGRWDEWDIDKDPPTASDSDFVQPPTIALSSENVLIRYGGDARTIKIKNIQGSISRGKWYLLDFSSPNGTATEKKTQEIWR